MIEDKINNLSLLLWVLVKQIAKINLRKDAKNHIRESIAAITEGKTLIKQKQELFVSIRKID